ANRVATALGMELPEPADAAAPVQDLGTSKAVQTIGLTPDRGSSKNLLYCSLYFPPQVWLTIIGDTPTRIKRTTESCN
ncbi:hypothetical protein SB761_28500, partial [Pseudomonas sp. SIMBA_064]